MRDELLLYYERELRFIRKMAYEFAEKYPEVAGRLLLEPNRCDDPHVERLIEAFAMLSARVHLRLDDDFPEITDALLGILYPHYLAPVPSMTVVQVNLDPEQGKVAEGVQVDRHAVLYSKAVEGVRCRFRTAYPIKLWPLVVSRAEIVSAAAVGRGLPPECQSALRLRIRTEDDSPLAELAVDQLTFYLNAESGSLHRLYELFFRDALGVHLRCGEEPARVNGAEVIRPLGFGKDEGLLDYPLESFLGYRLLQEYFSFPEKYLFAEVGGIDRLKVDEESSEFTLTILLKRSLAEMDLRVEPANFLLGCTPAVNLFPHRADPIRLNQASIDYRVTPDVRSPYSYEVYGVRDVTSTRPGTSEVRRFHPFYAVRHGMGGADDVAFWHAARRPSMRKGDNGTEVFLTLVDRRFHHVAPPVDVLHVEVLATNRDLASRLPFGDPNGDFELEGYPGIRSITCLRKPDATVRAPAGDRSRWRLVSHLALNYMSLTGGLAEDAPEGEGAERALTALREILTLYDFADSAVTRQRIQGLVGMRTRRVLRRIGRGAQAGFARGVEVNLEFDGAKYTGSGVYLFASVLERFLGLYSSINSFTQTVARVRNREEVLMRWPPRAGETQVL